jgi:hypothetical protein
VNEIDPDDYVESPQDDDIEASDEDIESPDDEDTPETEHESEAKPETDIALTTWQVTLNRAVALGCGNCPAGKVLGYIGCPPGVELTELINGLRSLDLVDLTPVEYA